MRPLVSFAVCCRCCVIVIDVVSTKVYRKNVESNLELLLCIFNPSLDLLFTFENLLCPCSVV